jgi:hypothetical protein
MDSFTDFDAQFEQTLALVNGGSSGEDQRDPNQFRPSVNDKRGEYLATVRFIPPASGPMFVNIIHIITGIVNAVHRFYKARSTPCHFMNIKHQQTSVLLLA